MKTEPNAAMSRTELTSEFSRDAIAGKLVVGRTQYNVLLATYSQPTPSATEANSLSSNAKLLHDYPQVIGFLKIAEKNYLIVIEDFLRKKVESETLNLLTERELQISDFVADGCSNKEIAKQLGISEWTISTHLRRIYAKLGVSNRAAMVHKCFSNCGSPQARFSPDQ